MTPDRRPPPHEVLAALRDPATIRLRCAAVFDAVRTQRSSHFTVDLTRLDDAAARVAALTRQRFPDGQVPLHSRWRHFEAGGVNRRAELEARLVGRDAADAARARIDLTVVSVLLDAGAGAAWRYLEHGPDGDVAYTRSEGLGVATFRAFLAGAFSDHPDDPLRVDAAALKRLDAAALRPWFQAGPENPLVGLDGRAAMLGRLGGALAQMTLREGGEPRPARVWDTLTDSGRVTAVEAPALLAELLRVFGSIFGGGPLVMGLPAGDVWPHRFAGSALPGGVHDVPSTGWVPFHKLAQWLSYSLVEPLGWAGTTVHHLDALTGLPEYRNGGLLLDCGAIRPRQPADLHRRWRVGDEFIVEWRALTVALLDPLADRVRALLGVDAQALPLAAVLEGGTWAAGRELAQSLRGGAPPLSIDSDGTVF